MLRTRSALIVGLMLFALVPVAGAQVKSEDGRSDSDVSLIPSPQQEHSAVEQLQQAGVIAYPEFTAEDLAALPESFWPAALSYDVQTEELVFKGERLIAQEVRDAKASARDRDARTRVPGSRTMVYVEQRFLGRMSFTESRVSDQGSITLSGPNGYLEISVNDDRRFTLLVHPPPNDVDAFFPTKYFVDVVRLVPANVADEPVVVGDPGGSCISCKCDTKGCGGGCDTTKCDGLKTCSGACGSCAWTSAGLACE